MVIVWRLLSVRRHCSYSSHVTAPYELSFYYFFTRGKPQVAQTLQILPNLFGIEPYSGQSSPIRPSSSTTEIKHCTTTEIRWNKNEDARTSLVVSTNRLSSLLKNRRASLLIGPWASLLVWNIIRTVYNCQRATSSMGTVNKNSSYIPVGPWVCLFVFLGCMICLYVGVCFVLPWAVESFPFMFWALV